MVQDPKTTRRDVLALTAPIAAGMTLAPFVRAIPAAALPATERDLDHELLALRPIWLQTLAAFEAALETKSVIDERCFARYPAFPASEGWEGDYVAYCAEVERIQAVRDAIAAEEGSPAADELEETTSDANCEMVMRIAAIPARTLRGLAFKAEVSANWVHDHPELIDSLMADIVAMAESA